MAFVKSYGDMCTPARVYVVLSVIAIIASLFTRSPLGILFHMATSILWAFFLAWLCDQGHSGISWFLVLWVPIVLFTALVGTFVFFELSKHKASQGAATKEGLENADLSDLARTVQKKMKQGASDKDGMQVLYQ